MTKTEVELAGGGIATFGASAACCFIWARTAATGIESAGAPAQPRSGRLAARAGPATGGLIVKLSAGIPMVLGSSPPGGVILGAMTAYTSPATLFA